MCLYVCLCGCVTFTYGFDWRYCFCLDVKASRTYTSWVYDGDCLCRKISTIVILDWIFNTLNCVINLMQSYLRLPVETDMSFVDYTEVKSTNIYIYIYNIILNISRLRSFVHTSTHQANEKHEI